MVAETAHFDIVRLSPAKAEHAGPSGCADSDLASIPSHPFVKSQGGFQLKRITSDCRDPPRARTQLLQGMSAIVNRQPNNDLWSVLNIS
jgi:hypothetical protein